MVTTTITDENDIKRIVRGINTTDLANAVTNGDKKIMSVTGRPLSTWSENDPVYGQLQNIGSLYGAWSILIGWNKDEYLDKAKEVWKAFLHELEQFRGMPLPESTTSSGAGSGIEISESDYGIHALNPAVPNYLSDY